MFKSLTREELDKIHEAFPNATFTVSGYISASSCYYGGSWKYDEIIGGISNTPIAEWVIKDIEGLGPFPVIKKFPSISIHVVNYEGDDK